MDSSGPALQSPETGTDQKNTESVTSDRATGSKSSKSSDGSSQSSHRSPNLSPSQNHPMTNSLVSNLDLGEENRRASSSGSRTIDEIYHAGNEGTSKIGDSANGRPAPLAPRHVLGQSTSLSRAPMSSTPSQERAGSNSFFSPGADDSALDALMEAHQKQDIYTDSPESNRLPQQPQTPTSKRDYKSTPNTRDASFGLDPDADTTHSLEGTPFRSVAPPHHHHRNSHDRSIYDTEEASAPSHTTAASGAPETMKTDMLHTQTVPTASATGMPRVWPRRTSRSPSESSSHHSSHSSQPTAPGEMMPQYPPSGSLTLAIFAKNISWQRRGYLILASIAINLGLPFINGVMLGFGEIFARSIVAPYIGLAPASININAPGPKAAGTSGAGLRYAGVGESKGAGGSRVSIESWELEPGQRARARR